MQHAVEGPLVLFDGVCNLCSASVQFLARRDAKRVLRYAAVQSATGQLLLKAHGLPLDRYESFLLIENGVLYDRSRAAFRTARYMDQPWRWFAPLRFLPRVPFDLAYLAIARNRYRLFGRKQVCMIPDPDLAHRFLP